MVTKGYGLTVHDIDMSCPADLEPYAKAYKLEQDNVDALMWAWWGNYGFSATLTAVERCLAGKKSKTKYIDKPISQRAEEDKELTEDEIIRLRYEHRLKMETLKANFDLAHPKKEVKANDI